MIYKVSWCYMYHPLTTFTVDETAKTISDIENTSDNNLNKFFGKLTSPSWEFFEDMCSYRCWDRRSKYNAVRLSELGLAEYDAWEIVKKTQGRVYGDNYWLEIKPIEG